MKLFGGLLLVLLLGGALGMWTLSRGENRQERAGEEHFRSMLKSGITISPEVLKNLATEEMLRLFEDHPNARQVFFEEARRLGGVQRVGEAFSYLLPGSEPGRVQVRGDVEFSGGRAVVDTVWLASPKGWKLDSISLHRTVGRAKARVSAHPEKFAASDPVRCRRGSYRAESYTRSPFGDYTVQRSYGSNDFGSINEASWVRHEPDEMVGGLDGPAPCQAEEQPEFFYFWASSNPVGVGYEGFVYYTLDGSHPEGHLGKGKGTTGAVKLSYHHKQHISGGKQIDWWKSDPIVKPQTGQTLIYKIGLFKKPTAETNDLRSSAEIFAGGVGERCKIGSIGAETYRKTIGGGIEINLPEERALRRGKNWRGWVIHSPEERVEIDGGVRIDEVKDPARDETSRQLEISSDSVRIWVQTILEEGDYSGFVYYTIGEVFPEGSKGTGEGETKVARFFKVESGAGAEGDYETSWWVSEDIKKPDNGYLFSYKIGFHRTDGE